MRRALRFILIALAVIIVVLIALPFFINANAFRPTIESKLSGALGRPTHVGDLKLALLSGGLTASDLSIADDLTFSPEPFLKAKSLSVGVELMPLIFSKSVRVTSITIDQPEIVLLRSRSGGWNFSSLATRNAKAEPKASSTPATSAGVPDFSVKHVLLSHGRVSIGMVGSDRQRHYEDVTIDMRDVSLASSFPFMLDAKLPGGGTAKLDGHAGPVNQADASLTPLDAKINIAGLDLGATGFVDPSAGLAGLVDFAGTLKSDSGRASARGQLKATKLQLVKSGKQANVPLQVDYSSDYDLSDRTGVINEGIVRIGEATAHLTGNYDLRGDSPVLNLKVLAQDMPVGDLQAMLPALGVILPSGAALQGGTMDTNLEVAGPLEKLVTTGTLGLHKTKLTGFDLGSRMKAVSSLAGINTGNVTDIELLSSNLRVAPEGIHVEGLSFVAPAIGEVTGTGMVLPDSTMDFKMAAKLNTTSSTGGALANLVGMRGRNAIIPFLVKGTTSDPKFLPDVAGLVRASLPALKSGNLPSQVSSPLQKLGISGLLGGKKKKD